ncbi:MAG: CatB-related O-acetyltransferase [Chlamydiales bacterium]|nr:CatB-related O-acetyltransferase [Chlamydiales bacterium]
MIHPKTPYPISHINKETIFLKNFITNPNIEVGDYTYYNDSNGPENFEKQNVRFGYFSKLKIGNFCQIAHGTTFILADANHAMDGFSTYPFNVFGGDWEYEMHSPTKGPTNVGHDVWFGHKSKIMPGVNIGNGAIIAAYACVTKDVPSYSIVAGNPAKVVKMRFSDKVIEDLEKLQWWFWDYAKISKNLQAIISSDIDALKKASL